MKTSKALELTEGKAYPESKDDLEKMIDENLIPNCLDQDSLSLIFTSLVSAIAGEYLQHFDHIKHRLLYDAEIFLAVCNHPQFKLYQTSLVGRNLTKLKEAKELLTEYLADKLEESGKDEEQLGKQLCYLNAIELS